MMNEPFIFTILTWQALLFAKLQGLQSIYSDHVFILSRLSQSFGNGEILELLSCTSSQQCFAISLTHTFYQTVVSDTGDFAAIAKFKPQEATTNISLILEAYNKPEYAPLLEVAVEYGKDKGGNLDNRADMMLDRLLVEYGVKLLKAVPGRVSI